MAAQHTPGPWHDMGIDHDDGPFRETRWIVPGPGHSGPVAITQKGNADLIAAAPDLLATCEALGAFTRDLLKLVTPEQIKAARLTTRMLKLNDQCFNALAKARGE